MTFITLIIISFKSHLFWGHLYLLLVAEKPGAKEQAPSPLQGHISPCSGWEKRNGGVGSGPAGTGNSGLLPGLGPTLGSKFPPECALSPRVSPVCSPETNCQCPSSVQGPAAAVVTALSTHRLDSWGTAAAHGIPTPMQTLLCPLCPPWPCSRPCLVWKHWTQSSHSQPGGGECADRSHQWSPQEGPHSCRTQIPPGQEVG